MATYSKNFTVSVKDGSVTRSLRVTYQQVTNESANTSTITITKLEVNLQGGFQGQLRGYIDVGTTRVVSAVSGQGSLWSTPASDSFGTVNADNYTVTSVILSHDSSGNLTIPFKFSRSLSWGSGMSFNVNGGNTYSLTTEGQVYNATAEKIVRSYTISYNANGGSSTPSSQTKNYGASLTLAGAISRNNDTSLSDYTVTFNANQGTCSTSSLKSDRYYSYTFASWKASNGTTYSAGGSYTANESTTMTAQWNSTQNTPSITLPSATRTGYTFNGWYTASSGGTYKGTTGTSYTPSSNETLYAQWTIISYTISYSANGGSSTPSSQTKNYGTNLTLAGAISRSNASITGYTVSFNGNSGTSGSSRLTASRYTSYTFSSWKATDGTTYSAGGTYSKNEGTTMTAQWSSSDHTNSITLPSATRTGYTFNGWYTASSGGTYKGTTGTSYTPSGNETLYAQWKALGLVQIYDGSNFNNYQVYIYNGTSWQQYIPYIYSDGNWTMY